MIDVGHWQLGRGGYSAGSWGMRLDVGESSQRGRVGTAAR
jgi:hypothetical protein